MLNAFKTVPTRAATLLLVWLFILRISGIYLFTRGFLLSRLSLSNTNDCKTCTLPPTHKRAIFLIIDALRFDFISPDPPSPPNEAHHHVFTLPQELSAKYPHHSFIFNAHSDPPTATMQRIKGVTTGSLPTFIDISANFGATSIEEDSLLSRLKAAGKKIAFMGDDTWMSLYADLLDESHPFDSFNVEDLHSVDNGVVEHLFPLLQQPIKDWDFLIGHFLGVDHAGHRVGPGHSTMKSKLQQMDRTLRQVVELLDDDTLLVVIGDHGMDTKGDHGGDDPWETSAATWIYSKSTALRAADFGEIPAFLLPNVTFPNAPSSHRGIQQIDLVPSLALLLGIPIPFNNLGTVVPELFARGDNLRKALNLNSHQIKQYLDVYRASASGAELNPYWETLETSYRGTTAGSSPEENHSFARLALESCRALWAQFSMTLIILGLVVILATIPATALFTRSTPDWPDTTVDTVANSMLAFLVGAAAGFAIHIALASFLAMPMSSLQTTLFGGSALAAIALSYANTPVSTLKISKSTFVLLIQSILLFSNSFVFWEERVVPFLLVTSVTILVIPLRTASGRLLRRGLFFWSVFVACVRLINLSTVCREEQGAYCHVTFYSSSVLPSPPLLVLLASIPVALMLPTVVRRFMKIAAADHALAPITVEGYLRLALFGGTSFWLFDWLESHHSSLGLDQTISTTTIRIIRTTISKIIMWTSGLGLAVWSASPLNLAIRKQTDGSGKVTVQVLGFTNSYGSFYLSFLLYIFTSIWITSQLSAQISLALCFTAFLAYLELVDTVRDVTPAERPGIYRAPTLAQVTPVALLALQVFYATGHQATLNSLQWKSAFILSAERSLWSPVTVTLNTIGPVFIVALATPLLALWAVEPFNPTSSVQTQQRYVVRGALRSSLLISNYFTVILLASAACAMVLRRHLMVWKVFAPRFMLAALCTIAVDLAGIIGMFGGVGTVVQRVSSTYQGVTE